MVSAKPQPELVDPEVTRRKIDRELEHWREHANAYRERGWLMLGHAGLTFDVGFLARLSLGGSSIPVMSACVRFDYTNYDLWPPSVEFIDPLTGAFAPPVVMGVLPTEEGPRNVLVNGHPETNRPFFCVPGTREYHHHPQHSGDSWLLHRAAGEGSLAALCDRIWRAMARSVVGLQLTVLTLPVELTQPVQLQMSIATGDIDALRAGVQPIIGQPGPPS